jgi:hypothetical protein
LFVKMFSSNEHLLLGTSRNNATAAARICRECLSKRPPNNKIFRRENRRIRKENNLGE